MQFRGSHAYAKEYCLIGAAIIGSASHAGAMKGLMHTCQTVSLTLLFDIDWLLTVESMMQEAVKATSACGKAFCRRELAVAKAAATAASEAEVSVMRSLQAELKR